MRERERERERERMLKRNTCVFGINGENSNIKFTALLRAREYLNLFYKNVNFLFY